MIKTIPRKRNWNGFFSTSIEYNKWEELPGIADHEFPGIIYIPLTPIMNLVFLLYISYKYYKAYKQNIPKILINLFYFLPLFLLGFLWIL